MPETAPPKQSMPQPDATLGDLERDALTELVNIGVSRAAASLRQMVGGQVLLSVPSVEIVTQAVASAQLGEREADWLVAVRQSFTGPFTGRALLIFPQANSLELVRAVMGDDLSAEQAAEMEQEALAEIGNVVLNGCLGTMANLLRQSIDMSLPEVIQGDGALLFRLAPPTGLPDDDSLVLFLYINFSVSDRNIRGYIAMLMDVPSMTALRVLIRNFLDSLMDDDAVG